MIKVVMMTSQFNALNKGLRALMQPSALIGVTVFISACTFKVSGPSESLSQTNTSAAKGISVVNVNKYTSSQVVCNPLDPNPAPQTNYQKGIIADLFYRTSAMPRMYKSTDYVQFAQKADQKIFLSDMNVPTRVFTEGFDNANGSVLKTDSGENLIEYFGLRMKTNLILNTTDLDGDYELALLSDDGTTLTLKSEVDEILIDNDGDHPTRMGCAARTIRMRQNVMVPVEVTYYQGPRYHIANVLMWRKISGDAGQDPLCGHSGNNLFYNPDNHSEPLQAVKDLESRGWKVLTPDNFLVSADKTDYNPCVQGTNPVISNFATGERLFDQMNFTWTTDIPATSQIQVTNVATGEVITTTSDNILRTENNITITGLKSGTTYKAQAISVSADLGRSISNEVTFTTL